MPRRQVWYLFLLFIGYSYSVKLYFIVCNNLLSHWWKSPPVSARPGLIPGYVPPSSVSMDSLPFVPFMGAVRVHIQREVVFICCFISASTFSLSLSPQSNLGDVVGLLFLTLSLIRYLTYHTNFKLTPLFHLLVRQIRQYKLRF